jgi:predicted PurR-regulated permease PerM
MDKFPIPQPERESMLKHRRDMQRQIILPIVLATLLALAAGVLAGLAAAGYNPGVSMWADISIIWMIIPMMLMALIIVALLVATIQGLSQLIKKTPHYTAIAQGYVWWLNAEIQIWTNKLVQPVLTFKTWLDFFVKSEEEDEQQKRD